MRWSMPTKSGNTIANTFLREVEFNQLTYVTQLLYKKRNSWMSLLAFKVVADLLVAEIQNMVTRFIEDLSAKHSFGSLLQDQDYSVSMD